MTWEDYLPTIAAIVGVAAVAFGGILISRFAAEQLRQRGAPPHQVRGVRILISVIAIGLALFILYFVFGTPPEVSGLTVSAVILIAASVVLQTTISNVIAGAILFRNRVLRLNDQVQISGVKGRVVQLGLVTTWLRMEDGSLASISNSTLLNGPLLNRSAEERLKGEY